MYIKELLEGRNHPIIVVDVQPAYRRDMNKFREIMRFVATQTGPVLMFINAEAGEEDDESPETVKWFWDHVLEKENKKMDWNRVTIVDKGYGYFRGLMDAGVNPKIIIALIRYMYQKRVYSSSQLRFPPLEQQSKEEQVLVQALKNLDRKKSWGSDFKVNWTSLAQLKRFSGAYLVGGARTLCLREVELLMNAFNIRYKRIDSLIYE